MNEHRIWSEYSDRYKQYKIENWFFIWEMVDSFCKENHYPKFDFWDIRKFMSKWIHDQTMKAKLSKKKEKEYIFPDWVHINSTDSDDPGFSMMIDWSTGELMNLWSMFRRINALGLENKRITDLTIHRIPGSSRREVRVEYTEHDPNYISPAVEKENNTRERETKWKKRLFKKFIKNMNRYQTNDN